MPTNGKGRFGAAAAGSPPAPFLRDIWKTNHDHGHDFCTTSLDLSSAGLGQVVSTAAAARVTGAKTPEEHS